MPQPPLGTQRQIQRDRGHGAHGDEHGLELESANVRDVGDILVSVECRVALLVEFDDPGEKQAEQHAQPDGGREDW